jgi:hypothetical protein
MIQNIRLASDTHLKLITGMNTIGTQKSMNAGMATMREDTIGPDERGGLNGSMQHLLAVYPPESQTPKSFAVVDLIAAPPQALLENTPTAPFF